MFYHVIFWFLRIFFRIYFLYRIEGVENIPTEGGAVIAANHASYLDPPAVGLAMPRKLNFMAKEDLFRIPILGYMIRALGAFPVRPASGDKAALDHGLKLLASGQLMGIFPQGRRASNQKLALRGGAVFLASKAQVPLIPVAVVGSDQVWGKGRRFPRPGKVKVIIGEPIKVPPFEPGKRKEQSQEIILQLQEAIASLLAQGEKGLKK